MKKKILWLVCMSCLVGYLLFGVRGLAFNQSKFKVQIVPLNCQFDVIDAGTNEIKYLTPVECGEAPAPQQPIAGSGDPSDVDTSQDDVDQLTVESPDGTDQGSGGGTVDNNFGDDDIAAMPLQGKGNAQPRTTQDVVVLASLIVVAGIATDVLLLNGWIGQWLERRFPFLGRRG